MLEDLKKYRKAIAAVIGVALLLVANYVPEYTVQLQVVIGILTALGVYEVPNEP